MKNKILVLTMLFLFLFSMLSVNATDKPTITAKSALLIHLGTGMVVYEKNVDQKLDPTVAPKLMTAILTLEKAKNLDETYTAKASAFKGITYISSAKIKVDETLTIRDLLYCLILSSSNEAANILGEYVSGNVADFIKLMNKRAKELGANNTLFTNTTGIYDENAYSTARDIMTISKHIIKLKDFLEIANASTYKMPETNLSSKRLLYTKNEMILESSENYISYAQGIKTSATSEGGYSLASLGIKKIGNRQEQMLCVVLGCPKTTQGKQMINAYNDTKTLYDFVYSTYKINRLIKESEPVTEASISLADGKDFALLIAKDSVETLLPSDITADKLEREIILNENITAPIEKGQELGEIILRYDGIEYGRTKLISQNAIKRNTMLYYTHQLNLFFSNLWVKIATVLIVCVFVLYIIYTIIYNKKRNRQKAIKRRIKF